MLLYVIAVVLVLPYLDFVTDLLGTTTSLFS